MYKKYSLDEISLKFIYFDTKQQLQYCCVLLGHGEVENNTTYISYDYFK